MIRMVLSVHPHTSFIRNKSEWRTWVGHNMLQGKVKEGWRQQQTIYLCYHETHATGLLKFSSETQVMKLICTMRVTLIENVMNRITHKEELQPGTKSYVFNKHLREFTVQQWAGSAADTWAQQRVISDEQLTIVPSWTLIIKASPIPQGDQLLCP